MWSNFNLDSPFYRMVTKILQMIWLNMLWFICCLPLVTIGASTTALYYVTMKIVRNEDGYITKGFFKSLRLNFRQGTIIWGILAGVGFILIQDYRYFSYMNVISGKIGSALLLIAYGLVAVMVFPVLAKFDNTVWNTLKTALYFAFRYLFSSVALLIMFCVVGYGFYTSVAVMLAFFLFGGALMAFAGSFLLRNIFDQYIREENEYEQEQSC